VRIKRIAGRPVERPTPPSCLISCLPDKRDDRATTRLSTAAREELAQRFLVATAQQGDLRALEALLARRRVGEALDRLRETSWRRADRWQGSVGSAAGSTRWWDSLIPLLARSHRVIQSCHASPSSRPFGASDGARQAPAEGLGTQPVVVFPSDLPR
jgi:hypothetical protein